jgi:hypothetical protein
MVDGRDICDTWMSSKGFRFKMFGETLHRSTQKLRNASALGVFVTLTEPTKPMRDWAIEAGMYTPEQGITKGMGLARAVRRIQILTIADLLAGKALDLPQGHDIATLKRAQRAASTHYAQPALIGGAVPES